MSGGQADDNYSLLPAACWLAVCIFYWRPVSLRGLGALYLSCIVYFVFSPENGSLIYWHPTTPMITWQCQSEAARWWPSLIPLIIIHDPLLSSCLTVNHKLIVALMTCNPPHCSSFLFIISGFIPDIYGIIRDLHSIILTCIVSSLTYMVSPLTYMVLCLTYMVSSMTYMVSSLTCILSPWPV